MLAVDQAQQLVVQHVIRRRPEAVTLAAALGLVLAEDVTSDLDMPPYDKALVDGYAIRCMELGSGEAMFRISEEIVAGRTPTKPLGPGQAARIMTGAMLPAEADAVVMIERSHLLDDDRVRLKDRPPKRDQNILRQGREMRSGEVVLQAGTVLRPQEIGLLATVGRTSVPVYRQLLVAVLSTGDEVVEPNETPGPGQIRNSNGPLLMAQVSRAQARPRYLGIARDNMESLRPLVAEGLAADVLLLSGGVSAGKLDLVPGVLQEHGVQPVFHKIAMKPGKPLFFGVKGATLVFGLPGNPVSALVGFELFVRPALRLLMGRSDAGTALLPATLAVDYVYPTDRPTYHPARLTCSAAGWQAAPVPWFGSPDLRAISQANAFVLFPPGEGRNRQGQVVQVLALEHAD